MIWRSSRSALRLNLSRPITKKSLPPLHFTPHHLSPSPLSAAMATLTAPLPLPLPIKPQSTFAPPPLRSQFPPKLFSNPNFPSFTPIRSQSSSSPPSALTAPSLSAIPAPQTLKSRLRNGDTLYGLFLCSASPLLAEIAGLAGYDFVVVDMEHGFGGISDALPCLRSLAATGTPSILRLPESTAAWAKKALDLGPQGIMFPMIDTPESAKSAVSYCRYPPRGVRGAAHTIVRASGYGIDAGGYLEKCEEELLIMCQVESIDAVGNIEAIAGVDGVDCIQMGPMDLSASMGYLWDPGNKKVKEVLRSVERAVLKTSPQPGKDGSGGAYLSGFAMPFDGPEAIKSRGYHMISGAVDIALFRSAAVEDVKKFKASLADESSEDDDDGKEGGKDGYWSE